MKNIPIQTVEVLINDLIPADYNPRKHDDVASEQLKQSILRFGFVDPVIANSSTDRKNIIIGGHFRWEVAKALEYKTVPVVYVDIPDLEKEKELNLRLNKNTGEFDWDLLAKYDESFLADKGYKNKIFPFKSIFKCGGCGGGVTAEEKLRKLKHGGFVKHTYDHCGRSLNYECDEPYITENDLIKQLIANIDKIKFNHTGVTRKIQEDIERYHRLKTQVLHQEFIDGHLGEFNRIPQTSADKNEMTKNYLLHILQIGTVEERQEALSFIKTKFILSKRVITIQK